MFNAPRNTKQKRQPEFKPTVNRKRSLLTLVAALALLAAACGGGDDGAEQAAAQTPAGAPPIGAQVSTAQTSIGEVLVDPAGLTLYGFIDDVEGVSTCFDTCATAWPPADGGLAVIAALDGAGFDSISRPDGTEQLRVAGRWPLYTFAGDAAPGDVSGQASGGVWFAVAPDGSLIGLDGDIDTEPNDDDDNADASGDVGGVETELGAVLTASDGLTVYAFLNDGPGVSNCNDPCSVTWPPVTSAEDLSPPPPADRVTIIGRDDGSEQVALEGIPLYTYIDDAVPGDIEGQGIGDVWFAISDEGKILTPPSVRIGSTDSGDIVIDDDGFALYTFANDETGVSNCLDPCSTTWPPVSGDTRVDSSLDPDQFGQISRPDGTTQLTLNGQPLYTFEGDTNPGDTNGIAVGTPGTWSVIPGAEVEQNDQAETAQAAPVATGDVTVAETSIGQVLTDANGFTLYGFLDDSATESACVDACADAWPPLPGGLSLDAGIDTDISTIVRPGGAGQTVIGNWPAYRFAGDAEPGDVNGQGSGQVWFAIAPDGSLIR